MDRWELGERAQRAVMARLVAMGVKPAVFRIGANDPYFGRRVDWEATAQVIRETLTEGGFDGREEKAKMLADHCMVLATHPDVMPIQVEPPPEPDHGALLALLTDDLEPGGRT
jgi:hypothetical protein